MKKNRFSRVLFVFVIFFSSVIFSTYGQTLDVKSITRGLTTEEKRQMLASLRLTLSRIRAARRNLNTPTSQNSKGVNDARTNLINPMSARTKTSSVSSVAKQEASSMGRSIQRTSTSAIQRQQNTGFPRQRSAPQTLQSQQNLPMGQQITPRESIQRPMMQQRQTVVDNRRVNNVNMKQNVQRNSLSRNSMGRSRQQVNSNPSMNRNMIPPNNNLPPVPGSAVNNGFSQIRNGRLGNPQMQRSSAPRGGNRISARGQGQLTSVSGNSSQMNGRGQGNVHQQTGNNLPSNRNAQVQNLSQKGHGNPTDGRHILQGHRQADMGHNTQRTRAKMPQSKFKQPPTPASTKTTPSGKSVGISVQVKRKTEVKKIPHNSAIPTQPSSTHNARPSSVSSRMSPTHPSPGFSPHSTAHGNFGHRSTAGHGPLPTSPTMHSTRGNNGGFKRTPPIPRPTPPLVLLPRFIRWQTLYPSGEMGMESAEALPSQRLILITSDQVPMYDEYHSSTTLMDFNRGMIAVRVEMPSGAFMPPTKVCFTMKNPGNFNQTKKELLRRSKSKMAMELGEVIHVIAAASNVQNAPTLQRTAGPFISKFCEEALFTNNVYKLVPEAPVEPGPQTITVSGLVSPIDPGRSLPISIAVDTAINFFGPNKVATTPPP